MREFAPSEVHKEVPCLILQEKTILSQDFVFAASSFSRFTRIKNGKNEFEFLLCSPQSRGRGKPEMQKLESSIDDKERAGKLFALSPKYGTQMFLPYRSALQKANWLII